MVNNVMKLDFLIGDFYRHQIVCTDFGTKGNRTIAKTALIRD